MRDVVGRSWKKEEQNHGKIPPVYIQRTKEKIIIYLVYIGYHRFSDEKRRGKWQH